VDPFWLLKIIMDPHITAHVMQFVRMIGIKILKVYISDMIVDMEENIPVS
jgi:hypothetical protein